MPVIRFKKSQWRYGMSYFLSCGNQKHAIHVTTLEYMEHLASLAARLLRARNNLRLRAQQKKGGTK